MLLAFLVARPQLVAWLASAFVALGLHPAARRRRTEAAGAHSPGLEIGLEFQAPAVSGLVGTDFREVAPIFDRLSEAPRLPRGRGHPAVSDEMAAATGLELGRPDG